MHSGKEVLNMEWKSRRRFLRDSVVACGSFIVAALGTLVAGCRCPADSTRPYPPATNMKKPRPSDHAVFEPAYLKLHKSGELKRRGEQLWRSMAACRLCPRECRANRLKGEKGFCQASAQLEVAACNPHFGEERSLVGTGGSGTIFFTHCSLRCVFCINSGISQGGEGKVTGIEELAAMMLHLQGIGCHNINVVTPTHYSAHILLALDRAAAEGLRLPVVYNTCGWERPEILATMDGVVDIYLPDFKYARPETASKYSSAADTYAELTKRRSSKCTGRSAQQYLAATV